MKNMYTVEQIRKAGVEVMLVTTVEEIIEKLIELYGSERQQLLQQTHCCMKARVNKNVFSNN